jgi:hypothetical protein
MHVVLSSRFRLLPLCISALCCPCFAILVILPESFWFWNFHAHHASTFQCESGVTALEDALLLDNLGIRLRLIDRGLPAIT